MSTVQFEATDEVWTEIEEFPDYQVSSYGRVINRETGYLMANSLNSHGVQIIGLMGPSPSGGRMQHKRALPLLVATAFVPRPENPLFDTPIHLDGNRYNLHVSNLAWRPLWHARKFMAQFTDGHKTYPYPVQDVESGDIYENSMHACVVNGILDTELRLSMLNNGYVFPTGQIFREPV